jgi:hypothetical protein
MAKTETWGEYLHSISHISIRTSYVDHEDKSRNLGEGLIAFALNNLDMNYDSPFTKEAIPQVIEELKNLNTEFEELNIIEHFEETKELLIQLLTNPSQYSVNWLP